eukprot:UN02067
MCTWLFCIARQENKWNRGIEVIAKCKKRIERFCTWKVNNEKYTNVSCRKWGLNHSNEIPDDIADDEDWLALLELKKIEEILSITPNLKVAYGELCFRLAECYTGLYNETFSMEYALKIDEMYCAGFLHCDIENEGYRLKPFFEHIENTRSKAKITRMFKILELFFDHKVKLCAYIYVTHGYFLLTKDTKIKEAYVCFKKAMQLMKDNPKQLFERFPYLCLNLCTACLLLDKLTEAKEWADKSAIKLSKSLKKALKNKKSRVICIRDLKRDNTKVQQSLT